MMSGLKSLLGILSLLNFLFDAYQKWKLRREARAEVVADIAMQETEVARKARDIVSEQRDPSDTARRMRDGKF